ncbi:hypothetical protein FOPG_03338 [Fusarium oxysporum f. sp. conglutinans race 2 54008]|uniref:Uncharacterized protein n=1 Tax=Fusarium oxysporum f. sp. conglutinans race 2 54008 TaxID=1089457 RepID=X0IJJ1_FUSOX|nr:hypothetical protein FOPG_03338 [Fusarium oxysporum f. sp. conglutinans race 2 54008]KAI8412845.1 hypothetical protein FOFC_06114 [Fusarium oxysporum]
MLVSVCSISSWISDREVYSCAWTCFSMSPWSAGFLIGTSGRGRAEAFGAAIIGAVSVNRLGRVDERGSCWTDRASSNTELLGLSVRRLPIRSGLTEQNPSLACSAMSSSMSTELSPNSGSGARLSWRRFSNDL